MIKDRITVEALTADQWPDLKSIRLQALATEHYPANYQTEAQFTEKQWRRRASSNMGQSFVLRHNDQAVGLGSIFLKHPDTALLCHTYIMPDYRGRNEVEKLDIARLQWGINQGLTYLEAMPSAHNPKSHARLEEWGFERKGLVMRHLDPDQSEPLALYVAAIAHLRPQLGV